MQLKIPKNLLIILLIMLWRNHINLLNFRFHHSSRILYVTLGVHVGVKKIRDIGLEESYSCAMQLHH